MNRLHNEYHVSLPFRLNNCQHFIALILPALTYKDPNNVRWKQTNNMQGQTWKKYTDAVFWKAAGKYNLIN
jgi:hypothetical protein